MDMLHIGIGSCRRYDPLHFHTAWEIICNTDGSGYMEIGDETVPFSEGSVVCVPPMVKHSKHPETDFSDVWIVVSDFSCPRQQDTPIFLDDTDGNILSIMRTMHSIQHSASAVLPSVIFSLFDSLNQLIVSRALNDTFSREVENVINAIIYNFHDASFSLTEHLAAQGYCNDHMRRVFLKETGMSPHAYLHNVRMKNARKLLSVSDVVNSTVANVAEMSGYSDVGYFSRVFKRTFGISPGEYSRRERKERK